MNGGLLMIPIGAAVVIGVLSTAGESLSLPVVSYDSSTGECVSVQSIDNEYSCGVMPERYIHQWVSLPVPSPVADPEEILAAAREYDAWAQLEGGRQ